MLKTKDGYAKVIGTSYQGSSDYLLLSNGGSKAISSLSVNYASNADKLDGEHASSFVRAGVIDIDKADLNTLDTYSFIKSVMSSNKDTSPKGNIGWYNVIQAVHRNGSDDGPSFIGQIALGMTTNTDDMFFRGKRTDPWKTVIHSGNIGSQTVANAYHLRINSANSWSTWNWAGQSGQPSWLWGSNDGTNMYVWNPSNFNVNTAQYLRSLGNQNCQTGRTQSYGDVYTYNTHDGNTGSPTSYTSVIGFGRGIAGTVEIAGGWCNTNLYWRSLRNCCEDWYPWRAVLDSSNYTEFINNYYWANVKISTSSSTTTSPTVLNLTATNALNVGTTSIMSSVIRDTNRLNLVGNHGGTLGTNGTNVMSFDDYRTEFNTPTLFNSLLSLKTESVTDQMIGSWATSSSAGSIVIINVGSLATQYHYFIFKPGYDGQILFLKLGKDENKHFEVCTDNCRVVSGETFKITLELSVTSSMYIDGHSRIFIYKAIDNCWYEFYCG